MPKYKVRLQQIGMTQNELLGSIKSVDSRVDKSLLSKMVNNICLPTPPQLDIICNTLNCSVIDIYDTNEINYIWFSTATSLPQSRTYKSKSHGRNIYNLTVAINSTIAERVLNPSSLKLLGYKDKSDFIRKQIARADARLNQLKKKSANIDTKLSNADIEKII